MALDAVKFCAIATDTLRSSALRLHGSLHNERSLSVPTTDTRVM